MKNEPSTPAAGHAAPENTGADQSAPIDTSNLATGLAGAPAPLETHHHTSTHASQVEKRGEFNHRTHGFTLERKLLPPGEQDTPFIVLPPGHTAVTWPMGIRRVEVAGLVTVGAREDFIAYLRRYCTEPAKLAVYALAGNQMEITATLDHHDGGASGPCSHRLTLKARLSPIMQRWKPSLNVWLSQDALIEFAEAEARYFEDGAKLVTMARHFEVDESMIYSRKVDPIKGTASLRYETKQNTNGEVPVPEKLVASIQVYDGGPLVKLVFIPRYKVPGGKLSFMLSIPDLPDMLLREFDTLVGQIREDIREFEGEGWKDVLVIGGTSEWKSRIDVEPVVHKGHDLPATIVAGSSSSDRRY